MIFPMRIMIMFIIVPCENHHVPCRISHSPCENPHFPWWESIKMATQSTARSPAAVRMTPAGATLQSAQEALLQDLQLPRRGDESDGWSIPWKIPFFHSSWWNGIPEFMAIPWIQYTWSISIFTEVHRIRNNWEMLDVLPLDFVGFLGSFGFTPASKAAPGRSGSKRPALLSKPSPASEPRCEWGNQWGSPVWHLEGVVAEFDTALTKLSKQSCFGNLKGIWSFLDTH